MRADAVPRPAWSPSRIAISARTLRALFAVATILMATSAFYGTFAGPPPDAAPGEVVEVSARGNLGYVALWLALYGVAGLIVLREIWLRGLGLRLAALVPFALYVVASATWALNPWGSVVFCTMLTLNIVVAAALAAEVHPAELMALLARTVAVLVAVSLVLLAVMPDAVVSTPDRPGLLMPGELYGVFSHKVALGTYAAMAILILLAAPEALPDRWLRRLALLVCAVGLALSNSASAVVALVIAGTLLFAARRLPGLRTVLFRTTLGLVILVAVTLPFVDAGAFAVLLGRPPTLTGRTSFWTMAPDFILERPWFGYGYGGFFDQDPYSRVWDLWASAEWFFTPNFHNSALDVTIALGVIGLFAYLVLLVVAGEVQANRSLGGSAGLLAALIVLLAVGSATDFQYMRHNGLPTILMFYAVLAGGRTYGAPR